MVSGASCSRTGRATAENSTPSTAPIAESTSASASSFRTSPARLPPSATRTAISRWRASARIRQRLATLPHATSRTMPTVPSRIHSGSRTLPITSSFIGCTSGR